MAPAFQFGTHLPFSPENAEAILRAIPTSPGVFALRGPDPAAEPYLSRAADLRRRMLRLLSPPESQSKRLNLRDRVHSVEFTVTGSEFESLLVLYDAAAAIFGPEAARKRLRLHTPYFLRFTADHSHPRVYSTNRLSRRSLAQTYGPFPSRLAAERYCDAVLDLFRLRRCFEDLEVHPEHPGCAYGEMKKCLAPCNTSCTPDDYATEARAVESFFSTHGQSMLTLIATDRDRASAEMEFEAAAAAHERFTKVKATASLADELVQPVEQLRGIIVQKSSFADEAQQAAIFLLEAGCLYGPQPLSTLGVRAVKEQTSVGSSLFAQPLMLAAVPLQTESSPGESATPTESPETRAEAVINRLQSRVRPAEPASMADHLSLLRRWYYRPENQRPGEFFPPNPDGSWPVRRILRGAARMALGSPREMAETDRAGASTAKTKILHAGREGVERLVPDLGPRKPRTRKSAVIRNVESVETTPEPPLG